MSGSAESVPAEANMMVVSRSPMIPDTVLAASIQAWVPREPACKAAITQFACKQNTERSNDKYVELSGKHLMEINVKKLLLIYLVINIF